MVIRGTIVPDGYWLCRIEESISYILFHVIVLAGHFIDFSSCLCDSNETSTFLFVIRRLGSFHQFLICSWRNGTMTFPRGWSSHFLGLCLFMFCLTDFSVASCLLADLDFWVSFLINMLARVFWGHRKVKCMNSFCSARP